MDTTDLVPMTRRRYRSLVGAAEDAARTAAAAGAPGGTSRRAPAPPVPLPRSRRRASIRRSPVPAAS